jgi:lipoyl(octanoyl) transferase
MPIFAALDIYHDDAAQSAAMNMAIDEALLDVATIPSVRFYRWNSPALSFGYFGKFADVADYAVERDLVRRWTGGGIVFHGDDLTYSIVIPASDPAFGELSRSIYEKIHRALAHALVKIGQHAVVAATGDRGGLRSVIGTGITDPDNNSHCFANPVRADIMIDGHKVAGAAQRRTCSGLLQQGSIQGIDLGNGLAKQFAKELSDNRNTGNLPDAMQYRAQQIAARKYATEDWLRKR